MNPLFSFLNFLFGSCFKRNKEENETNNTLNTQTNNVVINRLPTNAFRRDSQTSLYLVQKNIDTLINLQKIQLEAMKELKEIHDINLSVNAKSSHQADKQC